MSTTSIELTEERVINILSSRANIAKTGVAYKGVEIGNITYQTKEGENFYWKDEDGNDTDRRYAIVNLKAMSPWQQQEAMRLLGEGDLQGATNQSLSLNVDPETAAEWERVGSGSLITTTVINKDGVEIMVAKKFIPAQSIDATRVDFQALLKKSREVHKKGNVDDMNP